MAEEKKGKKITLSAIMVALGLFIIATLPVYYLMINNQKIELTIKSADQSVKELTVQNEDLLRGRVADRDSLNNYKSTTSVIVLGKDSTIKELQHKLTLEKIENKELKQEVDSIKQILRKIKWSDLKPVDDKTDKKDVPNI